MTEALRVFVVDDEAPARNRLRDLLSDCNPSLPIQLVGEAADSSAALQAIRQDDIDVVLLDIHMPGMDGLSLAQHLALNPPTPAIIFVTAYDNHAIKAFELNACDYLLKPVRAGRLLAALHKVSAARKKPHLLAPQLRAVTRGQVQLIPLQDVLWLHAEQKYVTAYTRTEHYLLEDSLANLEQRYPDHWLRIHRHSLVARHAIAGWHAQFEAQGEAGGLVIELRGWEQTLPVSRRQQSLVKLAVKNLTAEQG